MRKRVNQNQDDTRFHRDGSKAPLVGDRDKADEIETYFRKNRVVLGLYDVSTNGYIYYNSKQFIRK